MIVFVYGTIAEAIKIAPVSRRLRDRGIRQEHWLTCQHTDTLLDSLEGLGLPRPTRMIARGARGKPLKSTKDAAVWAVGVIGWALRNARGLRRTLPKNTVIVVHGDTLTTVMGAAIARLIGRPSAHIEAGLRSGDWRNPFPEELDRRIVGRLATIHYVPSDEAEGHLRGRRNVINTRGNTVVDAARDSVGEETSTDPYGVVLLHRFEFISNKELVTETVRALAAHRDHRVRVMVDVFSSHGLSEELAAYPDARIEVSPKLPYEKFIPVLRGASFVVTDSGGIQAESAILGVPTLIHRRAVEQREGLGENIVLSEWDVDRLRSFLENPEALRREPRESAESPSEIIIEDLIRRGFAEERDSRASR